MVLVVLASALVANNASRAEVEKNSRQIENGRFALELLSDAVARAGDFGYMKYADIPPLDGSSVGAALPDACSVTLATIWDSMKWPIQGYNDSLLPASLPSCIGAANYQSGTDVLVVRRLDTDSFGCTAAACSLTEGQIFLQTGFQDFADASLPGLAQGKSSDTDNRNAFTITDRFGNRRPIRRFIVEIFFISPCNVPATGTDCTGANDDGGNPIPTLKKVELSINSVPAPAFSAPIALVEGIEHLRLEYGIDRDMSAAVTRNGSPDRFTACSSGDPCTAEDWADAVTVRVGVLARSLDRTAGQKDDKTYNLGTTAVGPFNDPYKRHVYQTQVATYNTMGRR